MRATAAAWDQETHETRDATKRWGSSDFQEILKKLHDDDRVKQHTHKFPYMRVVLTPRLENVLLSIYEENMEGSILIMIVDTKSTARDIRDTRKDEENSRDDDGLLMTEIHSWSSFFHSWLLSFLDVCFLFRPILTYGSETKTFSSVPLFHWLTHRDQNGICQNGHLTIRDYTKRAKKKNGRNIFVDSNVRDSSTNVNNFDDKTLPASTSGRFCGQMMVSPVVGLKTQNTSFLSLRGWSACSSNSSCKKWHFSLFLGDTKKMRSSFSLCYPGHILSESQTHT